MSENTTMSTGEHVPLDTASTPRELSAVLRESTARLRPTSDSPRLDCELLLARALGVERPVLYADSGRLLDDESAQRFERLLAEREEGRPMAQIIGHKEFYSLDFSVSADVLAPRPETELLVEVVAPSVLQDAPRWLDLGTGCGAVAVALASRAPRARIVATDVSGAALEVAQRNAARLAPGRIRFLEGSWYAPLKGESHFDAIACNPPYVETALCGQTPLRFEPRMALDGGPDGLKELNAVISGAPPYLRAGGLLAVEHGAEQGAAARQYMHDAGLKAPQTHSGLAGRDRVTSARNNAL